ncbi:hypothetical protein [Streptomyces sp. Qhu_M48]|uniref:hypothetical protein n=1 Tax=Streptomyces sp. Qhu_M48 TaxID=3435889 RepID=UPI003F4F9DD0
MPTPGGTTDGDPDTLVGPLRLLFNLRSNGAAHARNKKWPSFLTQADLNKLQPDKQFGRLMTSTVEALDALASHAEAQVQPTSGERDDE